jgi:hypothetical protein
LNSTSTRQAAGKGGENYGNQQECGKGGKDYSNYPGDNSYPLGVFNEWLLEASIHCGGRFVTADRLHWVLTLKISAAEGLQQKVVGGSREALDVDM